MINTNHSNTRDKNNRIEDSREAGVRLYVIFCSIIASIDAINTAINMSRALSISGYFVRNCPDVVSGTITYFPEYCLPQCIPMSDLVW